MRVPRVATTLAALGLLALVGCGGKPGPVPVQGTVLLDGKPLEGATVSFVPEGGTGRSASGFTDKDGVFHLMTTNPNDGAVPGNYRVTVTKADIDPEIVKEQESPDPAVREKAYIKGMQAANKPSKSNLPTIFGTFDQTPLRWNVPGDNDKVLELFGKAPAKK